MTIKIPKFIWSVRHHGLQWYSREIPEFFRLAKSAAKDQTGPVPSETRPLPPIGGWRSVTERERRNTKAQQSVRADKFQTGFTLLELIIYMGLLSMILGSSVAVAYNILDGQTSLKSKVMTGEEGAFFISKIDWALSGVSSVNQPSPNTTGAVLSVNKTGYAQNPVVIDMVGGNLRIKRGASAPVILNDSRVVISSLSFQFTQATVPVTTQSIKASLYANGTYFDTTRLISK